MVLAVLWLLAIATERLKALGRSSEQLLAVLHGPTKTLNKWNFPRHEPHVEFQVCANGILLLDASSCRSSRFYSPCLT